MSFRNIELLSADQIKEYLSEYPFEDEFELQKSIVLWFKRAYPGIVFRSDLAGVKLHQGLISKVASIQMENWAHPDFTVFAKRGNYGALFVELKIDHDTIYKKNGELRDNKHITKQHQALLRLREAGYKAEFACGFANAAILIDEYIAR